LIDFPVQGWRGSAIQRHAEEVGIPAHSIVRSRTRVEKVTLPFANFGDVDGSDLMGIVWAAGPKTGTFILDLDNIRVE